MRKTVVSAAAVRFVRSLSTTRTAMIRDAPPAAWPSIPVSEWQDTRDTFQLWTQIVGKVRMANTPLVNHWWNVPLYVSARGLTTSLVPYGAERSFQVDFDLIAHELVVEASDGMRGSMPLEPMSVAAFYRTFMALLDALDLHTEIWPVPVELAEWIPFGDDETHHSYDGRQVHAFWRALVEIERVFTEFRSR